jgi:hypothetical protein
MFVPQQVGVARHHREGGAPTSPRVVLKVVPCRGQHDPLP